MKIGLIDVDGHNYPNLALMKISAWHKAKGDTVEWWWGWGQYDRVYMSKVFDDIYTPDIMEPINAKEIIKGGTGYGLKNELPPEIEHMCPDYGLYPEFTQDTAYGFLTRGCPNNCPFCIVSGKEGRESHKVADLSEWWSGQKNIVLMDPNLLACRNHMELLGQLAASGACVDINQGLDARLLTLENIEAIKKIKIKEIHFAWDLMKNSKRIIDGLNLWKHNGKKNCHGKWGTVYVLTNYNTTMEENLYRIYTLRDMGYDPYVMIYDKPNAPKKMRQLQRWCNNRRIFRSEPDFEKYDPAIGRPAEGRVSMERLTIRLNEVARRCAKISTNLCCEYNDCMMGKAIAEIKEFEGVPIDHLRELVQAEKDGRLVVLPWAVGQTIYEADQEHGVVRHTIRDVDWYMNSDAVDDAGNSWYDYWTADDERLAHLTREEAEAALKGAQS